MTKGIAEPAIMTHACIGLGLVVPVDTTNNVNAARVAQAAQAKRQAHVHERKLLSRRYQRRAMLSRQNGAMVRRVISSLFR